jgi:hypothetical protein
VGLKRRAIENRAVWFSDGHQARGTVIDRERSRGALGARSFFHGGLLEAADRTSETVSLLLRWLGVVVV